MRTTIERDLTLILATSRFLCLDAATPIANEVGVWLPSIEDTQISTLTDELLKKLYGNLVVRRAVGMTTDRHVIEILAAHIQALGVFDDFRESRVHADAIRVRDLATGVANLAGKPDASLWFDID